ncbi:M20/M25/M40 family metallo-hydrolase [Sandaracinus amylolyticus]|uniref:M20/M25/M40 family metallo-hydrolase n=1 Tax=Sandaracinus amylolyticus TaxID=927083 RepID=UPI001F1606CB|nr:M20/M25/M40 family metallo-hydrolase [Sandaracinus amylolyticus]UJR81547.1 Acetylornithine deacetylase/Succinyl-diaminopimelate desuccinylase [Sandaracinus amylolyticus]
MTIHPKTHDVAKHADERFEATLERLALYLRFPAISCDRSRAEDVRALATRIKDDLSALGFTDARVLELEGALPCVAAERIASPSAPTVLVYGHLDLQPIAGEDWSSPPHEMQRRGDRVYARGAADDMGGWVSHLAALESWLAVNGELPCNVKLLIEGEEEIGSPNLERFMDAYPEAFESDVMVLTDCENPSVDIPGLTVSLRGLVEVELVCEALSSDVHSGLWGNLIPDPSIVMMQLVSRLVDEDGRLKLGRQDVPEAWRDAAWDVPLGPDVVKKGARLLPGVEPLPDRGHPPAEWVWRQPAVTVLSTTLPPAGSEKNAVRRRASCVLSFRVAPGQEAKDLLALVEQELTHHVPGGLRVSLTPRGKPGMSWLYEPQGPAFDAADRAYRAAWGRSLLQIGVGGSIPFVALFGRRFGDRPLVLNGVMDPETGAHGPNESMHVEVFRKAIRANVHLYAELAAVPELAPKKRS